MHSYFCPGCGAGLEHRDCYRPRHVVLSGFCPKCWTRVRFSGWALILLSVPFWLVVFVGLGHGVVTSALAGLGLGAAVPLGVLGLMRLVTQLHADHVYTGSVRRGHC